MQSTVTDLQYALLIDAENISSKYIDAIIEETARYGTCTYRRVYGDWTNHFLKGWKEITLDYALHAVQQYSYTANKNATDTAIIIDAMDMLHTADLYGFILVSSDSDFTPLAMRLREGGKNVIGIGEEKTPMPFKSACSQFIHLENLFTESKNNTKDEPQDSETKNQPKKQTLDKKTLNLLKATINDLSDDESGWVLLATVGSNILKKKPDFDPRTYGHGKLLQFFSSQKEFETTDFKTDKGKPNYFVRVKTANSKSKRR